VNKAQLPLVSFTPELARGLPLGDLLSLGMQMQGDVTPETLLQEVADAILRVLGYPQVYIRLRNADTDELETCAFAGVPEDVAAQLRAHPTAPAFYQSLLQPRYRLSESYLIPAGQSVEREIQGASPTPAKRSRRQDRGVLLVPLRAQGGRLIGVIYVQPPDDPEALELPNIRILEAIARQAALALDNARLAARAARLLSKEQLLANLSRDVSSTLDLDTILALTIERIKGAFPDNSVALINDDGELMMVASTNSYDQEARNVRIQVGEGISGWVVQQGLPYLSNDLDNEFRLKPAAREIGSNRLIKAYISVPLRSGGKVIGTLNASSTQPNSFTYEDVDLLEAVAGQIGGPIASAKLYQEAQRLAEQVKRRNEQLMVLNTLARMAVSTLDVERMLTDVTIAIQHGFGYSHVETYIVDEETQELVLAAQASDSVQQEVGYRQSVTLGLLGRTYLTGQTTHIDDVRSDPDYYTHSMVGTRSELCVPIVANGKVRGILNLESQLIGAFTDEDVSVLETVADMLAGAMENARLYRRAQEAAVLEERSRLARDLHDSISQQLFSMTLTAQAARAQQAKNPARSAAQLERLQETAAAALAEMRALIFQLRPPGLSEQGLVAALHQHVTALGRREGLTVELVVNGEERYARGAEQALYRIVQESLNNVVKHAGACDVKITLDLQPDQLRLHVVDDGKGFDLNAEHLLGSRHLGLTSMRERAAEIGGVLELHSQLGAGTEVIVVVPRNR
jgi:signal transduction histidine kinase